MSPVPIGSIQARRGWTPTDILAPKIIYLTQQHLDTGSGKCYQWNDESGHGYNPAQSTNDARPNIVLADSNYNGKDVLDFDPGGAAADFMFTPVITGGQNTVTLAFIGHLDDTSGDHKIMDTNVRGDGAFSMYVAATKLYAWGQSASGLNWYHGDTVLSNGTRYLFVVEIPFSAFSTTPLTLWVNNTLQTLTTVQQLASNVTSATIAWHIGRWAQANLQHWDGTMAVLAAWDGTLSSTERANLYAWAQAEYNVS